MSRSLRTQLAAIFLGFLLLVTSSVAATSWLVQTQQNDATVINLAARQRMLTQHIIRLALTQPDSSELAAVVQRFDQTLYALRDGGTTLDSSGYPVILPPVSDPAIRARLDEVAQTWNSFWAHLPADFEGEGRLTDSQTRRLTDSEGTLMLAQLDAVVSAFEAQARAKIARLQAIQIAFLATALLLLAWGYWLTQHRIINPLMHLGAAARRIGDGHLAEPVPAIGNHELAQLARVFNTMRSEIAATRDSLESQVTQRTHELTAAFEFSQEIVQQLELRRLLRSVTDRARILMQAQAASLCLLRAFPDGDCLELVSTSGGTTDHLGLRQPVRRQLPLQVVGAGQTTVSEVACAACDFMRAHGEPSQCVAGPLRVGEETLGALCVVRRSGPPFSAEEIRALTLLANAAAIAINNARLAKERRRQAEENAALAEREKLAADLHDNLAQTLAAVNLKIDQVEALVASNQTAPAIQGLQRVQTALRQAYRQVRAALTGLSEQFPENLVLSEVEVDNLEQKLAKYVAQFGQDTGLAANLTIADQSALALPSVSQTQALYIVREALTNVHRHAQAQQVRVSVTRSNGLAQFIIEDDGRGFSYFDRTAEACPEFSRGDGTPSDRGTSARGLPEQHKRGHSQSDNHLGLVIMQTRAARSGGHLTIQSAPGEGTRIIAAFPLKTTKVTENVERFSKSFLEGT